MTDTPMSDDSKGESTSTVKEEVQMTPQMLTLGRSGSDLNDDYIMDIIPTDLSSRQQQASSPLQRPPGSRSAMMEGWFSRWTALGQTDAEKDHGDGEDHMEHHQEYHEIPDQPGGVPPESTVGSRRKIQHLPSSKAVYSSLMVQETPNDTDSGTAEIESSPAREEDALKQDCPFFFRTDDHNRHNIRVAPKATYYGLKTIRRNTNQNSDLFHYSNAVDCVSPVVLQHFNAKYTQLNHPDYDAAAVHRRDRHGSYDSEDYDDQYDLRLIDNDEENSSNVYPESSSARYHRHIVHADSVAASSLLFEQDGRRLMRLPRDQVRLWSDPDFEPGILSVEQCRCREDSNDDEPGAWHQHPLRYVLTVDDGIYRQVVTEMSPQQTRCCFVWGCLRRDQERIDICVAYVLFGLILLVLAINTLIERLQ